MDLMLLVAMFAIAAGRCVRRLNSFESALPTLAVSAALGLFAACVQRL